VKNAYQGFPSDAMETPSGDTTDDLVVHNEIDRDDDERVGEFDRIARRLKGQDISPTPDEIFNAFDAALDQFADVMEKYQDVISDDLFNTCAKFQQDVDTLLMSGLYLAQG
jgi:hypothetical protein